MRRLVVGVDGTESARIALEWAADTVGTDGHVHAVVAVSPGLEYMVDVVTRDRLSYLLEVYHDLDARWVDAIRGRVAELTADLVERSAPDGLSAAAAEFGADAIVVGAHVTRGGLPKRIGSTTRHLLRKLDVPLVVVPEGVDRGLPTGSDAAGTLVLGVGHGDATDAAVRWSAALADERGLDVVLVRATGDGPVFQTDGLLDLISYELHPAARTEWLERDLARCAELVQELSEQELAIEARAVSGLAAVQLANASETASLLVVGQHRSKPALGRHTAQPLRHLLTHARCPLVVVPEWAVDTPLETALEAGLEDDIGAEP
jgi:nucleotide-binding universal stress UspA family protein